jgi:hypothetical protein
MMNAEFSPPPSPSRVAPSLPAGSEEGAAAPPDQPWYAAGLCFSCQPGCIACCTGEPGYVWVDEVEVVALAAALGLAPSEFRRRYVRRTPYVESITELETGDCVLLGPGCCTVYDDRPRQCRSFPFWDEHLRSPADWARLARHCPGVNQGRRWPREEIEEARG